MIKALSGICILVLFVYSGSCGDKNDYMKEINEVKSGKRTTAYASWWNPDKDNATKALQGAIDSGAKQLIIDDIGHDWIIEPISLTSDQEIILKKGVCLTALKNGLKGLRDKLISAVGKNNIKIHAEDNALIKMYKDDYQNHEKYQPGEWRHALSFECCENIEVSNLTIVASGGDGIYIGGTREGKPIKCGGSGEPINYCRNIIIENVICDNNHRQGISVISAENLTIRRSTFKNTRGAAPMDGIDFEPNHPTERLVNCVLEDCRFINNANYGIDVYAVNLNSNSLPLSICIRRCTVEGNKAGIRICAMRDFRTDKPVKGEIKFEDCLIANAEPVDIINKPVCSFNVTFKNITWELSNIKDGKKPVLQIINMGIGYDIGGLFFENARALSIDGRKILDYKNWDGGIITGITGEMQVQKANTSDMVDISVLAKEFQTEKTYKIVQVADRSELNKLSHTFTPATTRKCPVKNFRIRHNAEFLQWAEKGKNISIGITLIPIGKTPDCNILKIRTPGNAILKEIKIPFDGKEHTLEFRADQAGLYHIETDVKRSQIIFTPQEGASGIVLNEDGLNLREPKGLLYFQVPAGVKDFRIEVAGRFGETVTASLLNSNMQLVQKKRPY